MRDAELARMQEEGRAVGNIQVLLLAQETGSPLADGLNQTIPEASRELPMLLFREPHLVVGGQLELMILGLECVLAVIR